MDISTPAVPTVALQVQQRSYAFRTERREILNRHREWLESNGEQGERADFSSVHLEGADLTDADLQKAWLNKAVLKGADLLLADLRDASLLQANLQDTNLLGTRFQGADLQGAILDNATGLQTEQLAGANLFGAELPAEVSVYAAVKDVAGEARMAGWLVLSMLVLNGLAWLRVMTTADTQLLSNAGVLPFAAFRTLPLGPVYLLAPILIFGLYIWFHLYLQRLWESVADLPAILPDGRRLNGCLPSFVGPVVRTHLKRLRENNPPLVPLEAAVFGLAIYWIVPATMVLFWCRYLTLQDLRGTTLHILLAVAASVLAVHFSNAMNRAFKANSAGSFVPEPALFQKRALRRPSFILISLLGVVLSLLSIGVLFGSPHVGGASRAWQNFNVRTWAAETFWLVGYSPVAQVTEADISRKPADWTGRDEELALVRGARLSGVRLRYVQAYGTFLAKANLWQADMQNAYLSGADLREVNARQARLRYAVLDRARLDRAILQEADLQQANLTRAALSHADLSYASLNAAALIDSTLDGASLYGADLRHALLQRASLQQADLREANLEGADLTAANLGNAYLSSAKMAGARLEGAQLDEAFLTQADLRGADLRNAKLAAATLNGANLQGTDLRGALGLTAMQVCSATNIGQAQLDDALRHDVESACGAASH
jgi:uncharacterized protein YjbI with pentapeptide repeats